MRVALFAYSRQGCRTARKIHSFFQAEAIRAYTADRFEESGFRAIPRPGGPLYGSLFEWADAMLFVGAAGIAVRAVAPFVRDKRTDPAVLVIDERGTYVIPILSGHIGGANDLAVKLAAALGAVPVLTTATDMNGKFSVDAWAARQGLFITDMERAKEVSAAILEHPVPLMSAFPIGTALPCGVIEGSSGEIGICISFREESPFDRTLLLVPPVLHLGIGCRRGTSAQIIGQTVDSVLRKHHLCPEAIRAAASIDLKADEEGLLRFAEERGLPLRFHTAEKLRSVSGKFTASERVLRITGVDNVCERAAMTGADTLIVEKTADSGVTVAVAAENWEVRFE